jgi:hypothetical protein
VRLFWECFLAKEDLWELFETGEAKDSQKLPFPLQKAKSFQTQKS